MKIDRRDWILNVNIWPWNVPFKTKEYLVMAQVALVILLFPTLTSDIDSAGIFLLCVEDA